MQQTKLNEFLENLKNLEIKTYNPLARELKHHEASKIEPLMSDSNYESLKNDIRLVKCVHRPIILSYDGMIIDGRHRDRAARELGITSVPYIQLKIEYKIEFLREVLISMHTNRDKSTIQKQAQAYDYKKTIANVTYLQAAGRYGVSERSIKSFNTLYNILMQEGKIEDFEYIHEKFLRGKSILPNQLEWVNKNASSIQGLIRQIREWIAIREDYIESEEIDSTEERINKKTGEIEKLKKLPNIFDKDIEPGLIEQLMKKIEKLEEKIRELENNKDTSNI